MRPDAARRRSSTARPDVGDAPDQREHADRRKDRRGQAGRERHGLAVRHVRERRRACGQQQHRHADQRRERSPEAREDAQQRDVTIHYATRTRSSTRVGGLCRGVTVKLKQVPSSTPAGTATWS